MIYENVSMKLPNTPSKRNILGVYQSPPTKRHRNKVQIWGALNKAWLGYVIAKSQKKDYEKMRSILSSKNSKMREYRNKCIPELELCTFGDFENKEEDDDSKLTARLSNSENMIEFE